MLTNRQKLRLKVGALSVTTAWFLIWSMQRQKESQIKGTPLFKGVMYQLRTDRSVKKWIGEDVQCISRKSVTGYFYELFGKSYGESLFGYVNHLRGRAQLQFTVEGSKGKGRVEVQAVKQLGERKEWLLNKMTVDVAGEQILRLDNNDTVDKQLKTVDTQEGLSPHKAIH
ncbi:hypothetical protein MIR68_010930 [Amoeboaphelidium protococcarum]|nr:hypothetical protein MIR68_010930 [Amoeboaphelidium protococcarum]